MKETEKNRMLSTPSRPRVWHVSRSMAAGYDDCQMTIRASDTYMVTVFHFTYEIYISGWIILINMGFTNNIHSLSFGYLQ